jgi:hypothetical protein
VFNLLHRLFGGPPAEEKAEASNDSDAGRADYRALLVKTQQDSQTDYDKAVLTLAGGALGISFAFLKDIVGDQRLSHTHLLLFAWGCWGFSLISILGSFFSSQLALRKAIGQLDEDKLGTEHPGGFCDFITSLLNAAGGLLLLIGIILMIVFVSHNLPNKSSSKNHKKRLHITHICNSKI